MQELEKLLNSLIQKGWKPWGKEYTAIDIAQDGRGECLMFWNMPKRQMKAYILRNLVSLESGLWQFCMENELCRKKQGNWIKYHIHPLESELDYGSSFEFQFRLLESALVPEEKLGKFLLDNIIIKGNSK